MAPCFGDIADERHGYIANRLLQVSLDDIRAHNVELAQKFVTVLFSNQVAISAVSNAGNAVSQLRPMTIRKPLTGR